MTHSVPSTNAKVSSAEDSASGGPLLAGRAGVWLAVAATVGILTAAAADVIQMYFAPFLIFPLLVGLGVGLLLLLGLRLLHFAHRPAICVGLVLSVIVCVLGQHYFAYRAEADRLWQGIQARQQQYRQLKEAYPEIPELAPPPPVPGFSEHLGRQIEAGIPLPFAMAARGWQVVALWLLDGILVLAGGAVIVVPAMYLPYCRRCLRWYRTVRGGRITLALASRLAELSGLPAPQTSRPCRYRLSSCHGGCSPTRLELSWQAPDGQVYLARTWLDTATRRAVTDALDEALEATQ